MNYSIGIITEQFVKIWRKKMTEYLCLKFFSDMFPLFIYVFDKMFCHLIFFVVRTSNTDKVSIFELSF